jgi:hypothetical protein
MTVIRDSAQLESATHLKRVWPLLERQSATRILPYAPLPWELRQCRETGFVFLQNPPDYPASGKSSRGKLRPTQKAIDP